MRYRTLDRDNNRFRFYWEDPSDPDNVVVLVKGPDGLSIAVAEEMAMDSYNQTFECGVVLPEADAIALRDFLNRNFPD